MDLKILQEAGLGNKFRGGVSSNTKLTVLTCRVSESLGSDGRAIKRIPYRGGAVLRSLDLTPYRRSYNP